MYLQNVAYGVGKCALDRMTQDTAVELKKHNVAVVGLWPGAVRTEHITASILGKDLDLHSGSVPSNQILEATDR